jgi:peptidoglycan hydrolase-like protein with peptidoglycan-binding domain
MNARMLYTTGYVQTLNLSNVADSQRAINMLRQAGYLPLESFPKPLLEDGNPGPYTRAAITAFQQSFGQTGTGRLDAVTRGMLAGALRSIGVQAEPNTPPSAVEGMPIVNIGSVPEVQWALNRLDPSTQLPQSGTLDDRTRQALIVFQKIYMLPATGEINGQTRRTIAQALVRIGIPANAPAGASTRT